jgi:hypothetical protein
MHTIADLETLTKKLSEARDELSKTVLALQLKIHEIQNDALPTIKRSVNKAAAHQAALSAAIDTSRDLFIRPRTYVLNGIKFGLQKSKGGINWEDDARVVSLIKKHFPRSQADLLIKTTEKPIASALADLAVADLKRIGCTVEDTQDQIVIKPVDDTVDKIVNALLADAIAQTVDSGFDLPPSKHAQAA